MTNNEIHRVLTTIGIWLIIISFIVAMFIVALTEKY